MFNILTESDVNKITKWIEKYAQGECTTIKNDTSLASMEHILRFWSNNKKQYLYSLLNNQLIFSKEIIYNKTKKELIEELDNKYFESNSKLHYFLGNFSKWLNYRLPEELKTYKYELSLCGRLENLAINSYPAGARNVVIVLPNSKTKLLLAPGTKLIKFLGKIAKAYNIDGFEDFAISCSQVLNQKTLKGKLCLSIHPLDYMTMSDNNNDWTSCMSWREDGCYRQGTVEMMNSANVIVAYLESENQQLEEINWNSKKWRELFIVTPNLITGVQGYPFYSAELEKEVLSILKQLAKEKLYWEYEDNLIEWSNECWMSVPPDDKQIKIEAFTNFMYNDIAHNPHLTRFGYISKEIKDTTTITIKYSGETECVWCGTENPILPNERFVLCSNCSDTHTCYCCGEILNSDETYSFNDHYYCEYCFDNEISHCDRCNSIVENEKYYLITVHNIPGWLSTYESTVTICADCYKNFTDNLSTYTRKRFSLNDCIDSLGNININYENLTSKGIVFMNNI